MQHRVSRHAPVDHFNVTVTTNHGAIMIVVVRNSNKHSLENIGNLEMVDKLKKTLQTRC